MYSLCYLELYGCIGGKVSEVDSASEKHCGSLWYPKITSHLINNPIYFRLRFNLVIQLKLIKGWKSLLCGKNLLALNVYQLNSSYQIWVWFVSECLEIFQIRVYAYQNKINIYNLCLRVVNSQRLFHSRKPVVKCCALSF